MLNEDVTSLQDNLEKLNPRNRGFAESLCWQFGQKGDLSDKQAYWVRKLTEMAENPEKAEPQTSEIGSFRGVYELFERASQNLKYPKIRLTAPDAGGEIALSRTGEASRFPGQINVTDGRRYGENVWYGRVDRDGKWTHGHANSDTISEVAKVLQRLSENPAQVAAEHGRLTGHCCFCNTGLEDERSTAAGYGPVCAKNYGLPWGTSR